MAERIMDLQKLKEQLAAISSYKTAAPGLFTLDLYTHRDLNGNMGKITIELWVIDYSSVDNDDTLEFGEISQADLRFEVMSAGKNVRIRRQFLNDFEDVFSNGRMSLIEVAEQLTNIIPKQMDYIIKTLISMEESVYRQERK